MPAESKPIEVHIPSIIGYEKVAMESAAAVAKLMGFSESRVEDLKTAISEACTNAMEHGNRLKKNTMVLVTLEMTDDRLEVKVQDKGKGPGKKIVTPDIEHQIASGGDSRGWGIFLIKNLVDEVEFKKVPKGGNVTRMVIHVEP
jgi:serine/threonine-protein kinase RsbW